MTRKRPELVKAAAQMWPRAVFDCCDWRVVKESLKEPGVYVLFWDDHPHYVGKTSKKLFRRIEKHAIHVKDRYYHFWNYFSAFVVPNAKHRDEVEGILIASMPTANSASPKIHRIPMPPEIAVLMRKLRGRELRLEGEELRKH